MPTFEIETGGKTYEVEAPDQSAALSAIKGLAAPSANGGFDAGRFQSPAMQPMQGKLPDQMERNIRGAPSRGKALAMGAVQGATLNFGDEIGSGIGAAVDYITGNAPDGIGERYNQRLQATRQEMDAAAGMDPWTFTGGQVAGAIATAPMTPFKAGIAGGAATGAAYGAIAGAGAGEGLQDRAAGAIGGGLIGGAIGGAVPAIGQGLGAIAQRLPFRGAINPEAEAARRVSRAMQMDAQSGAAGLSDDAFRAAQDAGTPVALIDRGGEMTRSVARSAANVSPEARATLNATLDPRYADQGARITNALDDILGGAVNSTATREQLQRAAQQANRSAYGAAYAKGEAGVWNGELAQLINAPAVQDAIRGAVRSGANKATVAGNRPIRNPFTETAQGFTLTPRPDGSTAIPTLAFWDGVKRNLDDQISKFRRAGEKEAAADIQSLKSALVGNLDDAIPEYAAARAGAARYFGAEDALDAGASFAKSTKPLDEARSAISKMNGAEKRLFAEGFADAVREKVANIPDRADAVKRIMQSPRERAKVEMALGVPATRRLEAQLLTEAVLTASRAAVQGNSTTARQLAELGLASGAMGGGTAFLTGDPLTGVAVATGNLARGAVNARVANKIAELLVSGDPKKIKMVVESASRNAPFMDALRAIASRAPTASAPSIGSGASAPAAGNGLLQLAPLGSRLSTASEQDQRNNE